MKKQISGRHHDDKSSQGNDQAVVGCKAGNMSSESEQNTRWNGKVILWTYRREEGPRC